VEHKQSEKRNITLSLPRTLLKRFKRLALEREKSVSRLLRELMEEAIGRGDSYERAYRSWRRYMRHPRDLGTYGKATWTRDELHERHR
jgi:predicted alpha/beta hydrolase